jgi:hypothetical protein
MEKRPICQSFTLCSIVVCSRTLIDLFTAGSQRRPSGPVLASALSMRRSSRSTHAARDNGENLIYGEHDGILRLLDDRVPIFSRINLDVGSSILAPMRPPAMHAGTSFPDATFSISKHKTESTQRSGAEFAAQRWSFSTAESSHHSLDQNLPRVSVWYREAKFIAVEAVHTEPLWTRQRLQCEWSLHCSYSRTVIPF